MRLLPLLTLCITGSAAAVPASYRPVVYDVGAVPIVRTVVDCRADDNGGCDVVAGEFRLLEDGKRSVIAERVNEFGKTDLGVALIVLLDASPSMNGRPMQAIQRGLAQLVARKRDRDQIAVLSFANDFRWEARWDSSAGSVESAFQNLQTRGNRTRIYDAVAEALNEFDSQSRRDSHFPLRRTILLLSDGHDEGSEGSLQDQVQRLSSSRTRLDAVGLRRSPVWMRSLQTLATAGFGTFRPADTPEALTGLLERGIDILLQTSVLEFRAEHLTADGHSHEIGIEHTPTGWRDTKSLPLPEYRFYKDRRVWIGSGVITAVAVLLAAFMIRRRRQPVAVAPPPKATPMPRVTVVDPRIKPEPIHRTATVVEPIPGSVSTFVPPSKPTGVVAAKPARTATVLAPHGSEQMVLCAISGPLAGQRVELNVNEFWIGSAANNHLCLSMDAAVSGNHTCIRREGVLHRLYDNESLNNTWVNGKPVGSSVVLLQPGDRITIGQSEFFFQS